MPVIDSRDLYKVPMSVCINIILLKPNIIEVK
jgi:hypothetical protein